MADSSFLKFPFLACAYISASQRQDESWSYRQALANSFLKAFLHNYTAFHMKWPLSLKPHRESERFVLIKPIIPSLYTGVLIDKDVLPETIGATWYPDLFPSDANLASDQHIVLHLHGGSYILGDGRTLSSNCLAKTLLEYTPSSHVLLPQYRLADKPNNRFPAQLQDAVAAYAYLIHTLRISPNRIILSGDSSGGHLALALLRYIHAVDDPLRLPPPKCTWLWSPWCDVPAAMSAGTWNHNPNYKTEYIPGSFPARGAKQFLGNLEATETTEPYVAPIWHPFTVPSPVLIITGGCEVLFHEHERLARDLQSQAQKEGTVGLVVERRVPHDVLMIGGIMGFQKEAGECAIKAGDFANKVLSRSDFYDEFTFT